MGSLASRDLLLVLLAAAAGVLFLEHSAIEEFVRELSPSAPRERELASVMPNAARHGYTPSFLVESACALLFAAASFGFLRALRAWRLDERLVHTLFWMALAALVFTLRANEARMERWLVVGALPLAIVCATSLPLALRTRGARRELAIAVGLAVWLAPPLPGLWQVWRDYHGSGLVALLVLSKIGDTAAYYVGGAIGKTHPFPTISPGKTTAGCVASFATATAIGGAFCLYGVLPRGALGVWSGLLAGAVVNVAAQAGDLFESWVKRRAGVKDSSSVFGPSGGMQDQIDSLLFSVPVAIAAWGWIF
jgi:phosphatidate cytidylyltransferase